MRLSRTEDNNNLLHAALAQESDNIAEFLLSQDGLIDTSEETTLHILENCLFILAKNGNYKLFEQLLRIGDGSLIKKCANESKKTCKFKILGSAMRSIG